MTPGVRRACEEARDAVWVERFTGTVDRVTTWLGAMAIAAMVVFWLWL